MQLTLAQVAKLFSVNENMVTRWMRLNNLPARQTNAQYRFNRAELLEWATLNHQPFSLNSFRSSIKRRHHKSRLLSALRAAEGIVSAAVEVL